ncbi:MAG: (2Fe-2S)-binding protein [Planctomycetota bacterium]
MIVCSCFGTTDRDIRRAYGPGGDRVCPAGEGCGNCQRAVEQIAAEAQRVGGDGSRLGAAHDARRTTRN